jgi:hypothetical protein
MRMVAVRKDGEEITFLNYNGESVTKRNMPVGVFWPSRKGNGFSFVPENGGHVFDAETYWYNVWVEEDDDRPARRPAPKKAAPRREPPPSNPADDDIQF